MLPDDLDVHPQVAMAILRQARFSITMEIYTPASTKATREALKRLEESLDGAPLLDSTVSVDARPIGQGRSPLPGF
jgi:hypothetical protein